MKRFFLFSTLLGAVLGGNFNRVYGAYNVSDRDIELNEVVISSTRASLQTPVTQSNITSESIDNFTIGSRELPYLLQSTPGVIATSDNGLGIGTVYIKVRGTNDTRINFTMDGVPMNSPEDHSIFWANMNSYTGSMESIQIQRGAGTSTNGTGAFGASVNMQSTKPKLNPYAEVEGSMGSYNSYLGTIKAGSGVIKDHLILDGRFSITTTDGYIDRTASRLGSYFASATWFARDYIIRLKNFGSYEHTGQAWNGVPSDSIKSGNREYNSLGLFYDHNGKLLYKPTTDNYWQNHTHLSFSKELSKNWNMQTTLHYTYGLGYYEDMKDDAKLEKKFGLNSYAGIKGDANRQKWLKNDYAGIIFNISRESRNLDLVIGGGAQYFDGDHWGMFESILKSNDGTPINVGNSHYYDSNAKKSEGNIYAKATYKFNSGVNIYADLQYRGLNYLISGTNDVFIKDNSGKYQNQILDINTTFHFFNPKAGISYISDWGNSYLSFAKISREPTRNNYTDNGTSLLPKAETMYDYELGYKYNGESWYAGFNLYYMDYKNQLIATGQVSDIGEALTENVDKSYRCGIEFETAISLLNIVEWQGNATLSRNKIVDFTEYVDNWDGAPLTIHYDETNIALSPSIALYSNLSVKFLKGFCASLTTQYVGRQFLDNSSAKSRSLDPYTVSDFNLSYKFSTKMVKEARLNLQISNLFGEEYASNGWVYSAVSESAGYSNDNRYYEDGLFVQAPRGVLTTLTLKF